MTMWSMSAEEYEGKECSGLLSSMYLQKFQRQPVAAAAGTTTMGSASNAPVKQQRLAPHSEL
jgi:hypothetical protein